MTLRATARRLDRLSRELSGNPSSVFEVVEFREGEGYPVGNRHPTKADAENQAASLNRNAKLRGSDAWYEVRRVGRRPSDSNPAPSVADTIWRQISMGTKMACGARQPMADDPRTLTFKVLRGDYYITVRLDPSDTYTVEHFRLKRGSLARISIKRLDDIYAEQLSDVIYRMVNK